MEEQFAYEQLTVEAFREKNYIKALKALILNRSVIDPSKAGAVLDDLMEANKDYWYLTWYRMEWYGSLFKLYCVGTWDF